MYTIVVYCRRLRADALWPAGANVAATTVVGGRFFPVRGGHARTSSDADSNAAPRRWLAASLRPLSTIVVSLDF